MAWSQFPEEADCPANDTVTTVDARLVEALYRAHGAKVLRRAYAILRNREAAEDVAQEVFLRVFRTRALFVSAQAQAGWLHRITTNICLNWLRDSTRHERILARHTPREERAPWPALDAALTLRALLENVPQPLQELALDHFVEETTQAELAARLTISRRTVGYRLEQFRTLALATSSAARP